MSTLESHDILPTLPVDVLDNIAAQLQPRDITRCWGVSKTWADAWSRDEIIHAACRRRWPGLVEMYPEPSAYKQEFRQAASLQRKRRCAPRFDEDNHEFISAEVSERKVTEGSADAINRIPANTGVSEIKFKYSLAHLHAGVSYSHPACHYRDGVVAWSTCQKTIGVDNLRKNTHTSYALTERLPNHAISIFGLGTDLLVLLDKDKSCNPPDHKLHIIDLEDHTMKPVMLPISVTDFRHCFVDGWCIAITTEQGLVLVLTYESKQVHVQCIFRPSVDDLFKGQKLAAILGQNRNSPGILLHPTISDIIFAVWIYTTPSCRRDLTVTVIKYVQGKPTQRFEAMSLSPIETGESVDPAYYQADLMGLKVSCQRMNPYGLYVIAIGDAGPIPTMLASMVDINLVSQFAKWTSLSFSVMNETFVRSSYGNTSLSGAMTILDSEDELSDSEQSELGSRDWSLYANVWDDELILGFKGPDDWQRDGTLLFGVADINGYLIDDRYSRGDVFNRDYKDAGYGPFLIYQDNDAYLLVHDVGYCLSVYNTEKLGSDDKEWTVRNFSCKGEGLLVTNSEDERVHGGELEV